jgi:uncharacterized membrane protein YeaQ/YmgE (transglycosylase-associated protein family)
MAISFGLMGDLAIGVAGAFVGGLPFQQIPAPSGSGVISAMIDATISALVLLQIMKPVRNGNRWRMGRSWNRCR